jgi:uncharacterized damage-inducible protein DinB
MAVDYVLGVAPGLSPQIGRLVSILSQVRATTLAELGRLDVEHLDYLHDDQSNSIGALLLHLAAVEVWFQANTFESRDLTRAEALEWETALDLGEAARRTVRGHGLDYYRARLAEVRAKTLFELARRDDAWLDVRTPFWDGKEANNYFKWFHVIEDELCHRGQMRWLRKRILP